MLVCLIFLTNPVKVTSLVKATNQVKTVKLVKELDLVQEPSLVKEPNQVIFVVLFMQLVKPTNHLLVKAINQV
jgi:multisubunit Na+/H+ antiporter MnhG subunit